MSARGWRILAALFLAGYFFWFAGGGLRSGFTLDELMNLWRAWNRSWDDLLLDHLLFFRFTPTYRPLGAVFYKAFFGWFGLSPFPYRLFCFALLLANMFLTYRLGLRLSGSRTAGALAALVHGYHARAAWMYYSSALCYDQLCFGFYYSTLLYYLRVRERLGWRQLAVLSGLYVAALNSKEMAVTLPVVIGLYELVMHPRALARKAWLPGMGATIAAAFIWGRVLSPQGLAATDLYQPSLSAATALGGYQFYIGEFFFLGGRLNAWITVLLLAVWLAAAWRWPYLRFCWALFLVGMLPLVFIHVRGLDAAYIPLTGLAISMAAWLAQPVRKLPALKQAGWFLAVAILWGGWQWAHLPVEEEMRTEGRQVQDFLDQLRSRHPPLRPGSRILWRNDPFGDNWSAVFLTQLAYQDRSLVIERFSQLNPKPDPAAMRQYDYVWSVESGRLVDAR